MIVVRRQPPHKNGVELRTMNSQGTSLSLFMRELWQHLEEFLWADFLSCASVFTSDLLGLDRAVNAVAVRQCNMIIVDGGRGSEPVTK